MVNENCVIRMGGLGDLAILSSSLLAKKQKEPHRNLVLGTRLENMELLAGAGYLSRVIFFEDAEKEEWFRVYDCRWGVEPPNIGPGRTSWENYTQRDRSDIFDDLLGIRNGHKKFSIPVDHTAQNKVRKLIPNRAIGFSPTSKAPIRSIPHDYVMPVAQQIVSELERPVVLFGKTEVWSKHLADLEGSMITNLIDRLTIKEAVALISLLEPIISPDTGIYHIAAALGRKALAIFGNIHPKTRTTYYPTVISLFPGKEGEEVCNPFPCWDVPHVCQVIPGFSGSKCMRLITPERIVEALKGIM